MSVKAAPSTSHLVQLPLSPSSSFDSRRLPHLSKLLSYHDVAHRHLQHHPHPQHQHQHRPHHRLHLGLRTPPVDEMSTTYQQAPAAYDSHALRSYASSIAHPRTSTSAAVASHDARNAAAQYYRYPTQQSQTAQSSTSQSRTATLHGTPSDRSTKSATPASSVSAKDTISSRRSPETLIYHSLQIPRCISSNGGSLADFAAQMTCLFWFESIDHLKKAETIRSRPNMLTTRLAQLAKPNEQFRKWVYNVLSTTQVTQNVILLALLFIYRLKLSTPQIKGREGSEYRLLTVALMLGNKFLDDNTYTNKTWAEVSCFSVGEIHVMEVEFLSNMRYNLLAPKDEWEDWLTKLACFRDYYEQALRVPASPLAVSPSARSFHSPLVSPTTVTLPAADAAFAPAAVTTYSPPVSRHAQNWAMYHANPVSPLAARPSMTLPVCRKRSPDVEPIDHPAKRIMRRAPMAGAPWPKAAPESGRLPVPHLTIVTTQPQTSQPVAFPTAAPAVSTTTTTSPLAAGYTSPSATQGAAASYTPATGYTPQSPYANQNMVSLPPLQTGMRAMSTVYQPSIYQSSAAPLPVQYEAYHPPTLPASTTSVPATGFPSAAPQSHPPMAYTTPSKHQHTPVSLASAYTSSPMAEPLFGAASGMHTPIALTPISHSPSVYLQQRASPYKPIRHVNRLLYPPPSASLDQYHLAVPVPPTHMHYQPLGRRNDLRTGVVPEFIVYNRGQQSLSQHAPQVPYAP
ncbi:hypothetical protein M431DRAFT_487511 [Trichoderma harzianum CBS 226.95]|uniref:Cyclin N-terminal domain-containing protein n=1 Tax=Trichoderma harzianum CBS 226.95 TaxID=983964 RepID=A0A2T3ZUW1_TRIHA|nr:hypothetical protein M431DRAFT_487511 [Trichoderma harzianum CBS 226.95]PTB48513.1 hypothetical protein M431DRAFT_487511 [Trichoderma harzianum CBS 226.95]